jgi:hypothetical protein
VNPFDAVRSRFAAVDLAFRGLRAQVHLHVDDLFGKPTARMEQLPSEAAVWLWSVFGLHQSLKSKIFFKNLCSPSAIHSCSCSVYVQVSTLNFFLWFCVFCSCCLHCTSIVGAVNFRGAQVSRHSGT